METDAFVPSRMLQSREFQLFSARYHNAGRRQCRDHDLGILRPKRVVGGGNRDAQRDFPNLLPRRSGAETVRVPASLFPRLVESLRPLRGAGIACRAGCVKCGRRVTSPPCPPNHQGGAGAAACKAGQTLLPALPILRRRDAAGAVNHSPPPPLHLRLRPLRRAALRWGAVRNGHTPTQQLPHYPGGHDHPREGDDGRELADDNA
mmetsp:Transcript_50886/g.121178  ORF Transcript_50886/g.121178 Transcript_50886/m.121178 type:complete len:205 (+) Transcript_50886:1574-2188(+)